MLRRATFVKSNGLHGVSHIHDSSTVAVMPHSLADCRHKSLDSYYALYCLLRRINELKRKSLRA